MEGELEGMEYTGSDTVFKEETKSQDGETVKDEPYDPEAQKAKAYQDYMQQYADATKEGTSVFADKGNLGIFWNLDVESLDDYMDNVDTLQLIYVMDSSSTVERDNQDWRVLDLMFMNNLTELEGGYVTTYAYDCAWDGATKFDMAAFRTKFGCDKRPFQPNFSLRKSPDIKINPYTGKKMPLV